MILALRLSAFAGLVCLWHFMFDFAWWQSVALGWLSALAFSFLIHIELELLKIKKHLGLED
jgi:hypothetical protein